MRSINDTPARNEQEAKWRQWLRAQRLWAAHQRHRFHAEVSAEEIFLSALP